MTVEVPLPRVDRPPDLQDELAVLARLARARWQLSGASTMYESGRSRLAVLDQLAAVVAAVDAAAVLVLEDHVQETLRSTDDAADVDALVAELVDGVRRYLRCPVRRPT